MGLRRFFLSLAALLLLCAASPASARAEARNLYVGDIVTLTIESRGITEAELRQKFQDFEIVELIGNPEGYTISIRTFDAGERTILLNDKEIVISVGSTLDDIERDDVFEGEAGVTAPGASVHWRVLFFVAAGVFTLSGAFLSARAFFSRKAKSESAHRRFARRAAMLSAGDDSFLVDLTFYFKEYLQSVRKRRIIGKTSAEIVGEIREISALAGMLSDIESWLLACDRMKFAGIAASDDEKNRHRERLLKMVEGIETNLRGANEGAA